LIPLLKTFIARLFLTEVFLDYEQSKDCAHL